jgi:PAS domain S-box-containing protein
MFDEEARDQRRLDALRDYDILDTPPEEAFDRLTRLAADLFGVEVAFAAFLDTDRQWFKSSVGLDQPESSRAASFCTHTIEGDGPLVIEDATDDERPEDPAFVTDANLHFYAGVPIRTPEGTAIGTFSIMASAPRSFSEERVHRLEDFAAMASEELERRREARVQEKTARRFETILEDPDMLVGVLAPDGTLLEANATSLQYIEASEDEVLGRPFWETPWWPEARQNDVRSWIERAGGGEYVEFEADLERSGGEFYRVEGTIRPVTGDDGSTEALVVSARDVTERTRREEELQSTKNFYEQVLEQVPIELAVFSPDAEFEYVNPQSASDPDVREWLLGHTNEEYCHERGIDPAVGRRRDAAIRTAAQTETRTELEELLETDEGPRHYLRVHGPLTNLDGDVTHVAAFGLDITEQKRREEKTSSLYTATEALLKAETEEEVAHRIEEVVRETFAYPLNGVHFAREGQLVPVCVSPGITERWPDMPARALDGDGLGARAYRSGTTTTAADLSTLDTEIDYKDLRSGACIPVGPHGVISIGSTEMDGIDPFDVQLLELLAADAAAVLDRIGYEHKLERQNDLFAKAQEIAQVGAWEYDVETSTLRWTDEVYRIYDLPQRSVPTVQMGIEHYHPADRSTIRNAFTRAVEEGESYDVELRLTNEEGEQRWVRTRGEPQFEAGEVVRVRGTIRDVTEAKSRERALRQSEERWRSLLEHLRSGVYVSVGGTIEYVNPSGAEILGAQDLEDLSGRHFRDFLPEDAEVDVEARLETLERGEPTAPSEYEIVGLDGTRRLVQVYSVPLERGGKRARQTVFRDMTEERRAQRQLQEREERIRGLTNSIPGVVYQFYAQPDGTYGCHFVSERAEDLLGIASDSETFYEQFLDHVPASVREDLLRSIDEAVEQKEPWRYELPFERPDGDRIWLSGASSPVQDEHSSGDELVFNGVLLDVTERKRAHRRLERYREYTGRLLDAMDDLFFVFDAEGTLRRWNSRVATASGYAEEELEGMSVLSLVPEKDRERTAEAVAEVLSTGRSKLETHLLTKDGAAVPYEVTGNRVEHPDGDLRLVSIGRDVTERNRREARLRDRRRKIESLYDTTKSLLTAERPEAVSKRIHDVITTVFDYPLSNTGFVEGGKLVPVDVTTDDSEGVPSPTSQPTDGDSVAAQALQTGDTVVVEDVQALDNDIDYGTLQSAAAIPIAEYGVIVLGQTEEREFAPFNLRLLEVLGTYAAMVLDRLQGEKALRAAKEEAEEASRLKSAMLANMSHEIRTPLTSVTGFAELLTDHLEGRMQTFAEQIYNGGMRLQKTLDSVLQLSRLEAGVYELDRTPLSLGALIEETVDMLRLSAEEKALRLNVQLPDGPVEGTFNEGAVNRILENLLENAIKFTPNGGTIEVRAHTDGDDAVLEVEDTGVGISEAALPDIFRAFKQESEGMAREYEGSGLGLSIVQRLADAHGGTVEVESEKGVGTRFTVRLPRSTPDDG